MGEVGVLGGRPMMHNVEQIEVHDEREDTQEGKMAFAAIKN